MKLVNFSVEAFKRQEAKYEADIKDWMNKLVLIDGVEEGVVNNIAYNQSNFLQCAVNGRWILAHRLEFLIK